MTSFLKQLEVLAGEIVKFRSKKELDALKRKKRNKEIIKNLKQRQTSKPDESDLFYDPDRQSKNALSKIKEVIDLGLFYFYVERPDHDPYIDVEYSFFDEVEGKSKHEAEKVAKSYKLKHPDLDRQVKNGLIKHLMDIYDEGGPSSFETYGYHFYLLPEKLWDDATVNPGPGRYLLNPSEHDLGDALRFEAHFWPILIFSDKKNEKKYRTMIANLHKQYSESA